MATVHDLYQPGTSHTNVPPAYLTMVENTPPTLSTAIANNQTTNTSSNGTRSLTVTGDFNFNSGGILFIALPTSLADLTVTGTVTITVPTAGRVQLCVAGTPTSLPSNIVVSALETYPKRWD